MKFHNRHHTIFTLTVFDLEHYQETINKSKEKDKDCKYFGEKNRQFSVPHKI